MSFTDIFNRLNVSKFKFKVIKDLTQKIIMTLIHTYLIIFISVKIRLLWGILSFIVNVRPAVQWLR